jgi:hypothetical protein
MRTSIRSRLLRSPVQGEAVRNKVALAMTVLALPLLVGACGGTQEGEELAGTNTAPTTPTTPGRGNKPARTDPHKSCDAQGINGTQLGVGTCTESGIQYVVANYGGVVKLRSLAVAITGVAVSPSIRGNGRTVQPERDAFLRVMLQVQNRGKAPRRFGFGQTMMGVAENNYVERTDVERQVHPESIARVNGGLIQPGETLRGDVLFDITEADYVRLQRNGRFFIWNFGGKAATQIQRSTAQLGQIRLYAVERS